jgi:hypothetical protein
MIRVWSKCARNDGAVLSNRVAFEVYLICEAISSQLAVFVLYLKRTGSEKIVFRVSTLNPERHRNNHKSVFLEQCRATLKGE